MIAVGQQVYFVPKNRSPEARYIFVTKVGRKWVTLKSGWREMRMDLGSWQVDGGRYSSPGKCYESAEAYNLEKEVLTDWRILHDTIYRAWNPPAGITKADIAKATELLRLESK